MPTKPSTGFALRFISGKYQGGEFPLPVDKDLVIGRSSDLDMVLVEDMVSRKHAKISTHDGDIVIMDLGSTNGTFVNGERIKKSRIKEGDRILIGTSIVKLIASTDGALDSSRGSMPSEEQAAGKSSTMSGSVAEVPLPDLLQLFGTSKKSGVLVIQGEHQGRIYLRQGRVYYALIDDKHDLGPMKALIRMMGWTQGDFELQPPTNESFAFELDDSTEALIIEAMRQIDELARIKKHLPPPSATLVVSEPLVPPLSELGAEKLDVFQSAFNLGLVQDVLDQAPGSDLETYNMLHELLQAEYLRVL